MCDIEAIAEGLTRLERKLLLGTATGWGSWMVGVAQDLIAKGLGRHDGFGARYTFDTPKAESVRRYLQENDNE